MDSLTLPAPAKLNLFLHVTGRRADGYHLLESVFVLISLADTVRLTRRSDGGVHLVNAPPGLNATIELASRAARALQAATGTTSGVDIELVKRIPQGAGLGGGSSDAATTLLGLNQLWGLALPLADLQAIGATLGADVPFFVYGQPALVRGIGEQLTAVTVPASHIVLASPGVSVATAAVFTHPDLKRNTDPLQIPVCSLDFGRNDLQPVATALAPEIARLASDVQHVGGHPRMTGSGSCVFTLARSPGHAAAMRAALGQKGWRAWAVRTLHQHPLYSPGDSATI